MMMILKSMDVRICSGLLAQLEERLGEGKQSLAALDLLALPPLIDFPCFESTFETAEHLEFKSRPPCVAPSNILALFESAHAIAKHLETTPDLIALLPLVACPCQRADLGQMPALSMRISVVE